MLKANLNAQIEQKEKELYNLEQDLKKMERLIEGLQKQKNILLSRRSDLMIKITDLQDEMEGDDKLWQ